MKLIAENNRIYEEDGTYLCSLSITKRQKEISDCVDRKEGESWLDYRRRTQLERKTEEAKRVKLARNIVDAYNKVTLG